jgi:hypothetical protein
VNSQPNYKFDHNAKGAMIPPQPMATPFGFALAGSLFLLPAVPHLHLPYEDLSPFFIQYLPGFWALRKAGLVSANDLALFEMFFFFYLLARAAYYWFFRRRHASYFTTENPPPVEMGRLWPSLISGMFKASALCMAVFLLFGPLVYFENALDAKYGFCLLQAFAGGWVFFTEGLMDLGLYSTFRSRFWPQALPVTDAEGEK